MKPYTYPAKLQLQFDNHSILLDCIIQYEYTDYYGHSVIDVIHNNHSCKEHHNPFYEEIEIAAQQYINDNDYDLEEYVEPEPRRNRNTPDDGYYY